MNKNKLTYIDLFAGCGGLSEGFMASGEYEGLAHIEWELPMVNTLRNRLSKKWNESELDALNKVIHFDIQKTEELIHGSWSEESKANYAATNGDVVVNSGLHGLVKNKPVDLIIGGPPCQAYSIAGRAQDKNGMKDDYRNYLFESFVKVVEHFQPKMFVFENVPGLLSAKPGDKLVTERIFEAFNEIGYEIRDVHKIRKSLYLASDFGVAQKRNRIILIGVNKKQNLNLEEIYTCLDKQKIDKIKTVKDAISDLTPIYPIENSEDSKISHALKTENKKAVLNHLPRFQNQRDINIFKQWITEDMNNKTSVEKIDFYNKLHNKKSNHAKYRNLEWDKPSPTIVAHLYKDGLMFIHPDHKQARSLTVREAARLQSFPDDFEFISSMGYNYKMIGNAVPVEMARKIALGLFNYLNNKK